MLKCLRVWQIQGIALLEAKTHHIALLGAKMHAEEPSQEPKVTEVPSKKPKHTIAHSWKANVITALKGAKMLKR